MEGREGSTPSIQATFFSMQLNNQSRSNFSYHNETYPHKQKSPKAYGIRLWDKKTSTMVLYQNHRAYLAKVHEVDTILQESVMQQQPLMNTQLQKLMFFQSFCT